MENYNEMIVQRVSDGKYFKISYEDSVKESCYFEDMNWNGGELTEVFRKEKTIYIYE